jgi:hypothetical protein
VDLLVDVEVVTLVVCLCAGLGFGDGLGAGFGDTLGEGFG